MTTLMMLTETKTETITKVVTTKRLVMMSKAPTTKAKTSDLVKRMAARKL